MGDKVMSLNCLYGYLIYDMGLSSAIVLVKVMFSSYNNYFSAACILKKKDVCFSIHNAINDKIIGYVSFYFQVNPMVMILFCALYQFFNNYYYFFVVVDLLCFLCS